MNNAARGERSINVPGVGDVKLCMTMASMAAIEDFFEVDRIQDALAQLGSNPGSRQVAAIISALTIEDLDGPKHTPEEIRKWPLPINAMSVAMEAMTAGAEPEEGEPGKGKGKRSQRPGKTGSK